MLQTITPFAVAILIGYLLGCFNLAFIISKVKKVDLQNTGSKNLGASNTFITVGKGLGVLVGACDIFKCTLVVILAKLLFPEIDYLPYIAGIACVMGHMFPFYLKFKGGKGFASFVGLILGIHWKYFIVIGICIILITLITKYIVLATMATVISYPIYLIFDTENWLIVTMVAIVSCIIIIKHYKNLIRIAKGEEFKFKI
ncbi:MAG: glycerol-3-phosphate 1-O-acyltransferase PlsY [Lachnospiraceae bacterium]|nr:glycerol-3-phosphate 1-O-acyltransferase PlsY [Lachnospiraceae bacterium]